MSERALRSMESRGSLAASLSHEARSSASTIRSTRAPPCGRIGWASERCGIDESLLRCTGVPPMLCARCGARTLGGVCSKARETRRGNGPARMESSCDDDSEEGAHAQDYAGWLEFAPEISQPRVASEIAGLSPGG